VHLYVFGKPPEKRTAASSQGVLPQKKFRNFSKNIRIYRPVFRAKSNGYLGGASRAWGLRPGDKLSGDARFWR